MNLISVLLLIGCFSNPTKFHVLYEVGRPASIEYNNAKRTVGEKWNILWVYADDNRVETTGYEKIGSHNDSVMAVIAKKKGENWQEKFYSQLDEELIKQNRIREKLKSNKEYELVSEKLIEPYILFKTKNKKQSKYEVHIVGQKKEDPSEGFITLCKFDFKPLKSPHSFDCKEQSLTLFFPQNGIK
ncbi:MAG: hypothetical protein H0V01_14580 [Bacteroidetes bacterium]|nr:hypothetical protein [Bacteroidota bacterium]HET6242910.1 hypothetical protein [Bacteroidia bacterium]